MVTLSEAEYRDKVFGGWLGKLIGCGMGRAFDGGKQTPEVSGYPAALADASFGGWVGTDFQLLWLRALQRVGPELDPDDLVSAWLRHLGYTDGELGRAEASFRRDVRPPISGSFDNPFGERLWGMARAELWGLLAPGDPEVAAGYALRDTSLDHSGPGVEAAVALAAMVSAAFVEREPAKLLEVGVSLLPGDSRVGRAVRDVLRWHGELAHWHRTREMLLRAYPAADVQDATIAAGLLALALLEGKGDFGRTLIAAARSGWSATCTCSAAGAVVGVILGGQGIPAEWTDPAPSEVAAGWGLAGLPWAAPVRMLAQQTREAGRIVIRSQCAGRVQLSEGAAPDSSALSLADAAGFVRQLEVGPYVTSCRRGQMLFRVDYGGPPTIGYGVPRRLAIAVTNQGGRSADLRARVLAPAGLVVSMSSDPFTLPEGGTVSFTATVGAPEREARISPVNPCTLVVSVEEVPEWMVPITLVGESLWYAAGPFGEFDQPHPLETPELLSGEAPLGREGWRRLSVAEPAVNLLADLEGEPGAYYLATDLLLPRERAARLRVGCNDAVRVWVNGREVFSQHEHRPVSPLSADEFPADFPEGWNRLVIKMGQCSPRRFLSFSCADLAGRALVEAVNTFPRRSS